MDALDKNKQPLKIAVLGGGTGGYTLLNGFKNYNFILTAIVNMADDGSSTGVLRDELGVLPPGDVRRCLVALSRSPKIRDLFEYRFEEGTLKGHAFGNLLLAALEKMTGSFAEAVETASDILNICGSVVPTTLNDVRLKLSWPAQKVELFSEKIIDVKHFPHDARQALLSLVPEATANPRAEAAIKVADIVVIAPGDLYTSLGPVLVIDGIRQALRDTHAIIVYVCNLVTKQGQTDDFDVSVHAAEIERFIGAPVLDYVLYNSVEPSSDLSKQYANEGMYWVEYDKSTLSQASYQAVGGDFIAHGTAISYAKSDPLFSHRTYIRHDAIKVAEVLLDTVYRNK